MTNSMRVTCSEHIQSMLENSENGIDAEELAKKLKGKVDSSIITTLLAD